MLLEEATRVLDGLDDAWVPHWVAGGWGVAVLVGRQTVCTAISTWPSTPAPWACLSTLHDLGYVVETDWLPARVELQGTGGAPRVDVHPVTFDSDGQGRQPARDAADFVYPPAAFTAG